MKTILVWIIGIVSVLLTSRTLFTDRFFQVHDTTHVARIAEMSRSLQSGEFPVRWSENFGFGYGMPLFSFYAPLPYYVAQIPYQLGIDGITTVKFLFVLNSILAFLGMYLYAKALWGRTGGTISAVLFTFSTYRAVDLFVRGAVGEVYAMTLIPFALYGIHRILAKQKHGVLVLSISLASILLSHNLIGMLTVLLVCGYSAVFLGIDHILQKKSKPFFRPELIRFGFVTVGILCAIAISAFYTIPAFIEKSETRVEQTITTGYFDYHNHFVALRQLISGNWGYGGSQPGLEDGFSFAYGAEVLFIVVTAVILTLIFGKNRERLTVLALAGFAIVFSLLTTNKTVGIWDAISVLKFFQFPWRFLVFSHVFVSLVSGSLSLFFHRHMVTKIMVIGIVLVVVFSHSQLFVPQKFLVDTNEYYDSSPEFIRTTVSKTLNDYIPPQIQGDQWPVPVTERIVPTLPGSTVTIEKNKPTEIQGKLMCPNECRFVLNIFKFPMWQMYIDGNSVTMDEAIHLPVYEVVVPSGEHEFLLKLSDTPLRFLSNSISMGTIIALTIYTIRSRKNRT